MASCRVATPPEVVARVELAAPALGDTLVDTSSAAKNSSRGLEQRRRSEGLQPGGSWWGRQGGPCTPLPVVRVWGENNNKGASATALK